MSKSVSREGREAVEQFSLRLRNALRTFRASDHPLWKRTQEGLALFQGLQLTHLPRRLNADIDRRFGAVNAILKPYQLAADDYYSSVSDDDLAKIQDLIEGFAFDPR